MPRVDPRRAGVEAEQIGSAAGRGRDGRWRGAVRAPAATYVPEPCRALEPALGGELVVGLLGDAARDAEVGGQGARARAVAGRSAACRRPPGPGSAPASWRASGTPDARSRVTGTGALRATSVLSESALKWPVRAGHFRVQHRSMTQDPVVDPAHHDSPATASAGARTGPTCSRSSPRRWSATSGIVRDGAARRAARRSSPPTRTAPTRAARSTSTARSPRPGCSRLPGRPSARRSRSSTRVVLARAAFSHSMNYRSAVVYGRSAPRGGPRRTRPRAAT